MNSQTHQADLENKIIAAMQLVLWDNLAPPQSF